MNFFNTRSNKITRRSFLETLGGSTAATTLLNLQLTGQLSASETGADYRALVCVFLPGGNDSFNMLAPVAGERRAHYKEARGSVALPLTDYSPLQDDRAAEDRLGIHKRMAGIHQLYAEKKAAFVANVGTLSAPVSLEQILDRTANVPLGLYSHSDQQAHWQTGLPDNRFAKSGWLGRIGDAIHDLNGESKVPLSTSFAGINTLQSGLTTSAIASGISGSPSLLDWDLERNAARQMAIASILSNSDRDNVYARHWVRENSSAISAMAELSEALEQAPDVPDIFSENNSLSQQLRAVSEMISARLLLNKKRQTFYVTLPGWDHHGSLAGHPAHLEILGTAITEFHRSMEAMGLSNQVTLFTASDFGRTLSSNGGGTDHGWGGNQIVVGGAVRGGKIYGEYPSLALGGPLDTGRGRFIPTTSVDEYAGDLARWMGVSKNELPLILPNIGRFYDISGGDEPLGMML